MSNKPSVKVEEEYLFNELLSKQCGIVFDSYVHVAKKSKKRKEEKLTSVNLDDLDNILNLRF